MKHGRSIAGQVHVNPSHVTRQALFLNTRVPHLSTDIRRAQSAELRRPDRTAVEDEAGGGPRKAGARDHVQSAARPNFPGLTGPTAPSHAAATARERKMDERQNLAKAKALVARSGTRGMRVTVWAWTQAAGFNSFAVKLLESLSGYRTSTKVLGDGYVAAINNSRNNAQIGFTGLATGLSDPLGVLPPPFTCGSFLPDSQNNMNTAELCGRGRRARGISACPARADGEPQGRPRTLAARRPRDRRAGAVDTALHAKVARRCLQAGGQLPIQPRRLRAADQPALGALVPPAPEPPLHPHTNCRRQVAVVASERGSGAL